MGLLGGILAASVLLIVGLRLSNRLSRTMEHQADAQADGIAILGRSLCPGPGATL